MSEFALSLIYMAAGSIVKTVAKVITKDLIVRFKDRTASMWSRDGSKCNTNK